MQPSKEFQTGDKRTSPLLVFPGCLVREDKKEVQFKADEAAQGFGNCPCIHDRGWAGRRPLWVVSSDSGSIEAGRPRAAPSWYADCRCKRCFTYHHYDLQTGSGNGVFHTRSSYSSIPTSTCQCALLSPRLMVTRNNCGSVRSSFFLGVRHEQQASCNCLQMPNTICCVSIS